MILSYFGLGALDLSFSNIVKYRQGTSHQHIVREDRLLPRSANHGSHNVV
jgi:hypothetical protein